MTEILYGGGSEFKFFLTYVRTLVNKDNTIHTLGNVWAVTWRVPSNVQGYHEYFGGCGVMWRAIMSNMEGYLE